MGIPVFQNGFRIKKKPKPFALWAQSFSAITQWEWVCINTELDFGLYMYNIYTLKIL